MVSRWLLAEREREVKAACPSIYSSTGLLYLSWANENRERKETERRKTRQDTWTEKKRERERDEVWRSKGESICGRSWLCPKAWLLCSSSSSSSSSILYAFTLSCILFFPSAQPLSSLALHPPTIISLLFFFLNFSSSLDAIQIYSIKTKREFNERNGFSSHPSDFLSNKTRKQ